MNRSRIQLDTYPTRTLSLHKPGVIPYSSRNISPILSNRHKYELKQRIWPKQTVESWFTNHSTDDRRAVYSFLDTLYDNDGFHQKKEDRSATGRRRKPSNLRFPSRLETPVINSSNHSSQRRISNNSRQESRASKRDLGEILESLESYRPSPSVQEKGIQTSATPVTVTLPSVNGIKIGQKIEKQSRRPTTSYDKYTETAPPPNSTDATSNTNEADNTKLGRRYLSHSWRVINPREDAEVNVRPENNTSSFFNYTKKVYPEYFFIHPDWY